LTPRGERRRQVLLDATLAIVGREGTAAVTHRAVAAEAGVPLAATTYYFSSKDELIREALVAAAGSDEETLARIAPVLERVADVDDLVVALLELVAHWLSIGRTTLIAHYELCLEAARRPELEALARAWTDAHVRALAPALECVGSSDPDRDAWIVVTALDGMFVDQLAAQQSDITPETLRPALDRLLRALVRS
jgi:DNA-binding transcriptional regulator YbjK